MVLHSGRGRQGKRRDVGTFAEIPHGHDTLRDRGAHEADRGHRVVAVEDLLAVLKAALLEGRLSGETVAVMGPEELRFSAIAKRIARTMGKSIVVIPLPVAAQRLLAWVSHFMPEPLISRSHVDMLADGISQPLPDTLMLPDDLAPRTMFTAEEIRKRLPA